MYTMTHFFGNREGVINKSNSNVKLVLWQITSICAIITLLGNSGTNQRLCVSHHFLKASTDTALL